MEKQKNDRYKDTEHIGDGVYAHWDGYCVRLSVNDHRNEQVVALEEDVIKRLVKYYEAKSNKKL